MLAQNGKDNTMSTAMVVPTQDVAVREHELQVKVTQEVLALVSSPRAAEIMSVVILNQFRKTPKLWQCSQESLMDAVARIARLRLDPAIPNEVWLIPYGTDATLLYGYGGLRKLALRSPEVRDIFAQVVCVNDTYHPAENPISLPVHKLPEGFQPRGRAIGYYAAALLTCGTYRVVSMSKAEVAAHRDRYSAAARSQFWAENRPDLAGLTNFDKMALKTVLRQLCSARHLSLDADVAEALAAESVLYQPTNAALQGQGDVPRIDAAVSRAVEASKSVEEHSSDLYGDQVDPTMPVPREEARDAEAMRVLHEQITTLLAEQGVSESKRAQWRVRQAKKYRHAHFDAMTVEELRTVYTDLLAAARQKAQEGVTPESDPTPGPQPEPPPAPEPEPEPDEAPAPAETCMHEEPELPMAIPPQGWREELRHLASNTLEVVEGSRDTQFAEESVKVCEAILRLCVNPAFTEAEAAEQFTRLRQIGVLVNEELGF